MSVTVANVTPSQFKILEVLTAWPKGLYALQIVHESNGSLQQGAIYAMLSRLQGMRLVAKQIPKYRPANQPGMLRPTYTITAAGLAALQARKAAKQELQA